MSKLSKHATTLPVAVQISPAHVHLTEAAIEELFCDKYRLHEHSRAGQPTQYVARESVTLVGPGGSLSDVPVIGPPRGENQIEVSETEGRRLGIEAPLRRSGDLHATPGIFIEGPRTRVSLAGGVIRSLHHVHMPPHDAARLGVADQDRVDVARGPRSRRMLLRDVLVKVSDDYRLELHLDIDEGARTGLRTGDQVVLRKHKPHRAPAG